MAYFQSRFSITIILIFFYIYNFSEREAEGTIAEKESLTNPTIETEEGAFQSNQMSATVEAQSSANTESSRADQNDQHQVNCTKTRSGRISKPPERFSYVK